MNNFFCELHTLVHMADVSSKSLLEVEKGHFNEQVPIHNPSFKKSWSVWHSEACIDRMQSVYKAW